MNFKINTDYIELHQLLKASGLCASGGEAKFIIAEGKIKVNGKTETKKKCKILPGQIVNYNTKEILVKKEI